MNTGYLDMVLSAEIWINPIQTVLEIYECILLMSSRHSVSVVEKSEINKMCGVRFIH